MSSWKLQTAPTYDDDKYKLSSLKNYLRIDDDADDDDVKLFFEAAVQLIENVTQRYLFTQTWYHWIDRYDRDSTRGRSSWWNGSRSIAVGEVYPSQNTCIKLVKGPVQSVNSIVTYDIENAESTFAAASYTLDNTTQPARIFLNDGYSWPYNNLRDVNAFRVSVELGYGTLSQIPADLRVALRKQTMHLYDNRALGELSQLPDLEKMLAHYIEYGVD